MYVLFYINGLREQYSLANDPAVKEVLKNTLTHAGTLSAPLFDLFVFTFGIGDLFFGFSLFREKGLGKLLSVFFMTMSLEKICCRKTVKVTRIQYTGQPISLQ